MLFNFKFKKKEATTKVLFCCLLSLASGSDTEFMMDYTGSDFSLQLKLNNSIFVPLRMMYFDVLKIGFQDPAGTSRR